MDIYEEALAHIDQFGNGQLLSDHLKNTACLAADFATTLGFKNSGYIAGLLHDIGKYSNEFQNRLHGGPKVDHSIAGAYLLLKDRHLAEAVAVASHHTGLKNMGTIVDEPNSFLNRIHNVKLKSIEFEEYGSLQKFEQPNSEMLPFCDSDSLRWFTCVHFLYSCLVDADYLDTESFFRPEVKRKQYDFSKVCDLFEKHSNSLLSATPDKRINAIRNQLLKECIVKGKQPQGLFSLTMPTGSGKTFSSFAFAVSQARFNSNIKRIIYVIPYLSIIEQTASAIRKIVGEDNVLEHHSVSPIFVNDSESNDSDNNLRLAAENWDVPIIITTNEQFFESLFSGKPGKCRKIHNIANSVIIFDEVQMLPVEYLSLFCSMIELLVSMYNVTAVLSTATQPSLNRFFKKMKPQEIITSSVVEDKIFTRYHIKNIGRIFDIESFAKIISSAHQVLVVVNRKVDAKNIYLKLPLGSRFYLSTNLTPFDRKKKIDEIKNRLLNGLACYVVSTSLIEAGVDIDFEVVYREINGLDSIIQAAGRCNREGKRDHSKSNVFIFDLGNTKEFADFSRKCVALRAVLPETCEVNKDVINKYYEIYYRDSETDSSVKYFDEPFFYLRFEDIGKSIKIIKEPSIGILIPSYSQAEAIIHEIKQFGVNKYLLRKAAEYTVRCPLYYARSLIDSGIIKIISDDFCVLELLSKYSDELGLDYEDKIESEAIFF